MTLMDRYLKIVLILLFLPAVSFGGQFMVTRVTDGDTIKVTGDGSKITIRLSELMPRKHPKRKMNRDNRSVVNPQSILPVWF